jgi:hypothetical protein
MKLLLSFLVVCLAAWHVCSQQTASQAACVAQNSQAIMTNVVIQTDQVTHATTVSINVTNLTPQAVYYVQFAISNAANTQVIVPVTSTGTYQGHFGWTLSTYDSRGISSPGLTWLRFTPTSGTGGVSCTSGVCKQNLMAQGQNNWSWDLFTFQVTGYIPTFQWYWQLAVGASYVTFGPLDMSLCYCANCDAGYFQRTVLPCTLGYPDSTSPLSSSYFNENEIMYSYAIQGNTMYMIYTDEHPLMLGLSSVTLPSGSVQTPTSWHPLVTTELPLVSITSSQAPPTMARLLLAV